MPSASLGLPVDPLAWTIANIIFGLGPVEYKKNVNIILFYIYI